jgi:CBS domain-containing protein
MSSKTARDLMTPDPDFVDTDATVLDAAKKLAEGDYGALPVCGTDGRLKGVVTDRDIVTDVIAQGKDPQSTKIEELATGDRSTVTIGADDSIDEALRTMEEHDVRRLPVIDGDKLVGIVSQADLAKEVDPERFSKTVEDISSAPAN